MSLPKQRIIIFRLMLVASFIVITYLATTGTELPGVERINDKLGHLIAFCFLALVLDFSFPRARFDMRKILILLTYGLFLEFVQYFLPYREFSVFDLAADGTGILLYWVSIPLLYRSVFLKQRWE